MRKLRQRETKHFAQHLTTSIWWSWNSDQTNSRPPFFSFFCHLTHLSFLSTAINLISRNHYQPDCSTFYPFLFHCIPFYNHFWLPLLHTTKPPNYLVFKIHPSKPSSNLNPYIKSSQMPPSFYDGVILVQWLDKNNGLPLVSFVEHHTLQMIAATLQKKNFVS